MTTEFVKSHWQADGDRLSLSMPFAKIDKETRIVSGFATLDNVDSERDVVTAEASAQAFARARGNLREMHQKDAVGHIVDFREEEFFHDGEFYRGIYVNAYVSKGAPNTWEKVIDGTLTGFSIGGNILDSTTEFVKEQNATVRFIKDYDLVELSLVDNPANELANVFSITKSADGKMIVKGLVVETNVENVFWCATDEMFKAATDEHLNCTICGVEMNNIGWFESGTDRTEKVRDIVTKFLGSDAANDNEGEGGVEMSNNVTKSVDEEAPADGAQEETSEQVETEALPDKAEEVEETEEVAEAEEVVVETAPDEAVKVDEVGDEEDAIIKRIDELKTSVHDSLEKTREAHSTAVENLEGKLEEVKKSFDAKISELNDKFTEFGKALDVAKEKVVELEDALEKYNKGDTGKKSGDADGKPGTVQKSSSNAWNGAFSVDTILPR